MCKAMAVNGRSHLASKAYYDQDAGCRMLGWQTGCWPIHTSRNRGSVANNNHPSDRTTEGQSIEGQLSSAGRQDPPTHTINRMTSKK